MARHGAQSRSSSSRRGTSTSSRRVSASSEASEEERQVVLPAPPSPRCVKRRDFKAQGRARSRAKNLRRMESEEGGGGLGADLVQTSNGGGQAGVIEGGEAGGEQEVCPDEEKKVADNPVEVTEPPFIMVEAYTVGGLASESPGREEDLSPTTSSHTQVVEAEESSLAMEEEASVVMRKNEHNEFLSSRGSEGTTTKPDSLDLEQEHEHTSGFWTHRSSVISVTDSARGSSVMEVGSPTESVRDFLMQKRSSLTHTPDVVRVLQKLEAQHAGAADVHEFQKVKNELKHVDEDGATYLQLERISQLANFSNINSETFESEQETVTEVDTSSRNVVVNMMPAPIKPFSGAPENESAAVEEKKVEPKANAQAKAPAVTAGRKKQSSTKTGPASGTKGVASKKILGAAQPPKVAKSGEGTLQSPNLIQLLKPAAQNGTDKPTSSPGDGSLETPNLLKEVNGVARRMSSKVAAAKKNPEKRLSSPAQMQGAGGGVATRRHVPRPAPPSQQERRSKSPDKIQQQPTSLPPLSHLNNASSEANKGRKQSNASVTSVKSTHSDQEQRRASFKPTESNVKGGFLAPTKAWLSLRGENVSLNSRSPSPGSKLPIDQSKERSMSPKRKLRESSAESDSQSRKSVSFGLKERRAVGKDPALPTVRRSSSLRASSEAAGKRTRVLKKASMENLTTQNGVNEVAKAKKEHSLTRTSKERVSVRQTSRSKESLNRNGEAKPGGSSRDVSKENTKLSAVKRSSSLRRDSSKETTKKEAGPNNGLSEKEAKGSNLRKRNASKENGGSQTSSNDLANGVGSSGHGSINGTAPESIPPKVSTSIENGHLETVDKCAKVTKTSSAKSESQRKEARSMKNETNKTKNATTETAAKSEVTETAKTTISSSTVSAVSRTSTERRSSESKSSVASMSQMKMVEKGKSSSSSEKTSSETTLVVGETESSTSSGKAVKEICETGKKTSSNRVKTSTNSAIVASSTTSCVRAEGSTPRADLLRTTMVVRFRPGQPNQQGAWLADVQTGGSNTNSICGLEISFSSVPQDIDIKVIPSNSEEPGAPPTE